MSLIIAMGHIVVRQGLVAGILGVEVGFGQRERVRILVGNLAVQQERVAGIERCEVVEVAHFLCNMG